MADDLIDGTYDWGAAGNFGPERLLARGMFVTRSAPLATAGVGIAHADVQTQAAPPDAIPEGWAVVGRFGSDLVADGPGGAVAWATLDPWSDEITVHVCHPDGYDTAVAAASEWAAGYPPSSAIQDGDLPVTFWADGAMGPISYRRRLDAPTDWAEIEGNYTATTRERLAALHAWSRPPLTAAGGRLILAHGAPGTGKTTVLRSLGRAWQGWADVEYIVDPDKFFGTAAYMVSVLLSGESDDTDRWRLIVVEDCDEFLTVDAREKSGQSLGLLLNLCDGLIGQGLRVLLYLTTNAPVEDFHPAIKRPGRCMANLEFGGLTDVEADAWRAARSLPETGTPATVAELFAEQRAYLAASAASWKATIGRLSPTVAR